jgi:hypothetical protein
MRIKLDRGAITHQSLIDPHPVFLFLVGEKSYWSRVGGNLCAGIPHLGPNYFF